MTEECLEENPERYVTFSVPIQKELANGKTVTYKIKFVDSVRFILSPLSSLANNLPEGLYKDKCKDCKSSPEYVAVKGKFFRCNKNYEDLKDLKTPIDYVMETLTNFF